MWEIEIIKDKTNQEKIKELAEKSFGEMAKAVIDIEKEIIAVGGELHADAEALLVENGSSPLTLWGINIYPNKPKDSRIEFTSLINIRPAKGNRDMEIQNTEIKEKIKNIFDKLIQ